MGKATPGPWEVVRGRCGRSVEVFGGGKAIAEMWDRSDNETQEANARLIAAAPTLLEALKLMVQHAESAGWEDSHDVILHQAQEAIKRAEGGEE